MNSRMAARGNSSFAGSRQYSADDLQRLARANSQVMMNSLITSGDTLGDTTMTGTNNENMDTRNVPDPQRRNTYHPQVTRPMSSQNPGTGGRRLSMMEFGSLPPSDLDGFQFAPSSIMHSPTTLQNGGGIARRRMEARQAAERQNSAISLDTQFADISNTVTAMEQSPLFRNPMTADPMAMETSNDFLTDMDVSLDMTNGLGDDLSTLGMYPTADFPLSMGSMLPNGNQMMTMPTQNQAQSNATEQTITDKMPRMKMSDAMVTQNFSTQPMNFLSSNSSTVPNTISQANMMQGLQTQGQSFPISPQLSHQLVGSLPRHQSSFSTGAPIPNDGSQPNIPQYPNAYSSTGFDMLGVLMRVATRPNAQINIGAVDMSCAFVVCDVTQHDVPIVYCSEMFERLTGYSRHEILGRNCRFLQAPDGKVQAGLKRKYVDDSAVLHLKNMINLRSEAQISLINYRKGGQPFMNLLTMIPISWEKSEGARYYVGFQVDLVEQPTSITNKNPDGTYSINYQRGFLPSFHFNNTPETNQKEPDPMPVVERDDVAMVLGNLGSGTENETTKRMWDKVLLENTDDVLHVLSLKGLFLYLSQASKRILEYQPHELVGTALSSVCHPSDIVPVTRELKDTAPGATVNVVFRIRRKFSGYTWFESHGALHTEQGKGKKCIILVGRERPVYALRRSDLVNPTILGENELWTKMSTSGMFLYVSSHSRSLLDRQPDELIGTSAQALMRAESKAEFNKMLELARVGVKKTFKHDIQNKRGQTLHAQTTLYPGDAVEGQKPTFLVAQTKLLKMTRGAAAIKKENTGESSNNGTASNRTPMQSEHRTPVQSGNGTMPFDDLDTSSQMMSGEGIITAPGGQAAPVGSQMHIMAQDDNVFDELKTTRSTSWQFELRQMEKRNRVLAEEMQSLISSKKKRKRRKGLGQLQKDCANCHTRSTPEWRRGPSGNRDLCNSCGLRWAKQNGRVSPRTHSSHQSDVVGSGSPQHQPSTDMADKAGKLVPEKKSPQTPTENKSKRDSTTMSGVAVPEKIEELTEPPD